MHDDGYLVNVWIFVNIDCKILLALILVCGEMMLMLMDTCFFVLNSFLFDSFWIKPKSIPLDRMTQTQVYGYVSFPSFVRRTG